MGWNPAEFTTLRITEADDRIHAQLDRPEVRNAIDSEMVSNFMHSAPILSPSRKS